MGSPLSCPIHRDEKLVTLFYHEMRIKNGKKTGAAVKSKFLYCRKCELPLRITVDSILKRVNTVS
jgi:hypothetical protein